MARRCFPGERGGHLDIHHFRPFQWRPAQEAVGIAPLRRVYDLRHTFATFNYGHLARDGREHAIKLLDALNAPEFDPWTLVDARWTPKQKNGVKPDNDRPEIAG